MTRVGVLFAVAATGCGPTEITDARRMLLQSWGDQVIVPLYRDFESGTAELTGAVEVFCAAPSDTTLQAAQDAWWAARAPWKRAEIFAFGPYSDEPLRLGPLIDFWPARTDVIEDVLSGTDPITAESVALLGAPAKGMPAIEYLLFQPDIDVIAETKATPRRCDYLQALADDLVVRATEMREAWDPEFGNYLAELTEAGRTSQSYMRLQDALGEVVNRMGFTVENIRNEKLGRPVGATTGGTSQPDKAESRFSGRSLEDIRDNLRGIEALYFDGDEPEAIGLSSYFRQRGKDFDDRMRARLDAAFLAIDQIPEPLTEAVVNDPSTVEAVIDELGELQVLIQVDVIGALSLTVGFNDNDGD